MGAVARKWSATWCNASGLSRTNITPHRTTPTLRKHLKKVAQRSHGAVLLGRDLQKTTSLGRNSSRARKASAHRRYFSCTRLCPRVAWATGGVQVASTNLAGTHVLFICLITFRASRAAIGTAN